jgi:predicted amidohydrolase YtcJ
LINQSIDFGLRGPPSIKNKGLIVVQNLTHLVVLHLIIQRYGSERTATIKPLISILDADIPLAMGSDGIGEIISSFSDIMLTVIQANGRFDVEKALMAYTSFSAYAKFTEHVKGTLKPGMLSDIAVLSQDVFSFPPIR